MKKSYTIYIDTQLLHTIIKLHENSLFLVHSNVDEADFIRAYKIFLKLKFPPKKL